MKIMVTGAFGFIGSSIAQRLSKSNHTIIACDEILNAEQIPNALRCNFVDWVGINQCLEYLEKHKDTDAVVHQGAISDTTFSDGPILRANNFEFSKSLASYCFKNGKKFIYASSASVYGLEGTQSPGGERPLNLYGFSKLAFDIWIEENFPRESYLGLRYFNVYGPGESHKGRMASVVLHAINQLKEKNIITLFGEGEGSLAGEHRRDFVYVQDIANFINFALENQLATGIVDFGTGTDRSFNELANVLIDLNGSGAISYAPFPQDLVGKYQSFTRADMSWLSETGFTQKLTSLEEGTREYLKWYLSQGQERKSNS